MDLIKFTQEFFEHAVNELVPVDLDRVYSDLCFEMYGPVYLCGKWVSDDPAYLLERAFPDYYEDEIKEFTEKLVKENEIMRIGRDYYYLEEIKELAHEFNNMDV